MRATNEMVPIRQRASGTRRTRHAGLLMGAACTALLLAACSRGDRDTASDTGAAPTSSASASASAPSDTSARSDRTTVRGQVAAVTDTALTVTTRSGNVHVTLMPPVTIYTRVPATLADVRTNTFVGVTSVPDPDGSQHATEIHIFPEALRGTGEGSYPLPQPSGASASRSTMTNGSVAAGGSSASSRMTNGAARVEPGGTITVQYAGGVQTIKVPAGVSVTKIAPANEKLATGANVIVIAMKQPSGMLQSSTVFLARDSTTRH